MMTMILHSIASWKNIKKQELAGCSIGFIPTMGNLHQGHLSLCQKSALENDITVISIYVNPTQFNDTQDFSQYPRTLAQDMQQLEDAKVDYCLLLSDTEMYADDFNYQVYENQLSQTMEGIHRPGHFTGMLTIVLKLLSGVAPTNAYFGEKDYQQYLLISSMQKAFFIDCEIIACPTIREDSGLPFSSRNRRLSLEDRKLADKFAQVFLHKDVSIEDINQQIQALGIEIDYCQEYLGRRWVAVRIGPIRILDNYASSL